MIVCICHRTSDRDIARAVRAGCASFEELQDELGVATACGTCHDCARETFHAHADAVGASIAGPGAPDPSPRAGAIVARLAPTGAG